jgi:cytochrome c553
MKQRVASGLGVMLGLAMAVSAVGADALKADPQAGAAKAAVCGACHGATGNSVNPQWPNLAAQHSQYTTEQLHYLKSGVRVAAVMNPMAANLSEQDMVDLAAYFERQKPTGLEANKTDLEIGQKLYRAGDPSRGIPACSACHGPNGRGNAQARWPQIRAQHAEYVASQLANYAEQKRYTSVQGQSNVDANAEIMSTIAKRLTPQEMAALGNYVQGLR